MPLAMLPPGLAERVSTLVKHRDPGARQAVWESAVGGFSNLVFFVDELVVKAARSSVKRADLQREAAILGVIGDLDLGAASLYGSLVDDQWALIATQKIVGTSPATNWARFVFGLTHDAEQAFRLGRAIGHRLRSIHSASPFPIADFGMMRSELIIDALGSIRTSGESIPGDISSLMLSALSDPTHHRGAVFIHGDFGLHNLLIVEKAGLAQVSAVLDWELAGWGNPVSDLAWLAWTLWFRDLPGDVWRGVVSAYGDWAITSLGWNHTDVVTSIVSQMALLITRTDAESAVRQVWVERVRALGHFVAPSVSEGDDE